MAEQFALSEQALQVAGYALITGAQTMTEQNVRMPDTRPASLTGIGADVREYLQGLQTGRSALADAAKTASVEISAVLQESSALDASLTQALATGFAVPGWSQ